MSEQTGFFFDAPLEHIPVSQLPPPAPPPAPKVAAPAPSDNEAFVQAALVVLETIEDGFDIETVLAAMGVHKLSISGWHKSRILDAVRRPVPGLSFDQGPYGPFQAYRDGNNIRYRRLPPVLPCRGWDGADCKNLARGAGPCAACKAMEAEDEFNQE
jgi:hypothetical protein